MSLKAFHIVFIIFSTLLALALGAWCIWVDLVEGAPIYITEAIASFIADVALVVFGLVHLFADGASDGMSILLRRQRWKIDRTYGGGHLVSFRRGHGRPGRN